MSRKIGIYKITNLINSKLYIGKSKDIENRYKKHLTQLKHNNHINKHFQNSFNKYGEDNFLYEIIEECELNLLNDKEKYWINYYDCSNPLFGYNKTKGGDGLIATDEIKSKISKSLLGVKHSEERKLNQSKSHIGLILSEETKEKQSISQTKRFQDKNEINKHRIAMSKKSVIQYDLNNNFIQEFISIREAERITGVNSSSISRVCNNERKTTGKFIWKYK